jgi:hypothetical protein
MARVTGLEPATSGVTGRHSNRLSYTRALAPRELRGVVGRGIKGFGKACQALRRLITGIRRRLLQSPLKRRLRRRKRSDLSLQRTGEPLKRPPHRAISSVGRALRLHRRCRRFEPVIAHHFSRRQRFAPALALRGTAPCIARHGVATDRLTSAASSAWRLVPVLSKMSLSLVRAVSKEMLSAAAASRSASPVPIRARRAAPPTGSARKPCTASPRPPCLPWANRYRRSQARHAQARENRAPRPRPGGRIDGMKAAIAVAQQAHERRVHVERLPEGVKSASASPWLKVSRLGGS